MPPELADVALEDEASGAGVEDALEPSGVDWPDGVDCAPVEGVGEPAAAFDVAEDGSAVLEAPEVAVAGSLGVEGGADGGVVADESAGRDGTGVLPAPASVLMRLGR